MIYELLFSATGRSEKILNTISQNFDGEKIRVDLSDPNLNINFELTKNDFCIFNTSVIEGRIPIPALRNIKKIKGNGAKILLVAVFGNRSPDDCLLEMKNVTTELGFLPIGAISASMQHSVFPNYATNRPDNQDIKELNEFSLKVKEHLNNTTFPELKVPGNFPYIVIEPAKVKPSADENCIDCGLCASKCPMEAIPMDNFRISDSSKCIDCMRCVEICPVSARSLPKHLVEAMSNAMYPRFKERKPNNLYLA